LKDYKQAIADLWDNLPEDTLIASLLDPRFKLLNGCPQAEIDSAWLLLEAEFKSAQLLSAKSSFQPKPAVTDSEESEKKSRKRKNQDEYDKILTRLSKRQHIDTKDEFSRWKELMPVDFTTDVMQWWRENERNFPVVAALAKKFLAVPASQASTERSFSTAKRIVSPSRASLKPHHVEKLVVWHQSSLLMESQ